MGLSAIALNGAPGMRALSPQDVNAGLAAPYAAAALLGQFGAAAILVLIILTVTIATSAELMAVSNILTYDVYKVRPQWTPRVILMTPTFCTKDIYRTRGYHRADCKVFSVNGGSFRPCDGPFRRYVLLHWYLPGMALRKPHISILRIKLNSPFPALHGYVSRECSRPRYSLHRLVKGEQVGLYPRRHMGACRRHRRMAYHHR